MHVLATGQALDREEYLPVNEEEIKCKEHFTGSSRIRFLVKPLAHLLGLMYQLRLLI